MERLALVEVTPTANHASATLRGLRLATAVHRRAETVMVVTFAVEIEGDTPLWHFCTEAADD